MTLASDMQPGNTVAIDRPTSQDERTALIKGLDSLPDTWALTPLIGKKPFRKNWQNEDAIPKGELAKIIQYGEDLPAGNKRWFTGYGIRTGSMSGNLLAIDIDGPSAKKLMLSLASGKFSPTVCWSSGREGRAQLLYIVSPKLNGMLCSTQFTHLAVKTGVSDEQLDFRYNGSQSALPPSRHPDTDGYAWLPGKSPSEIKVANAPDWLEAYLINHVADIKATAKDKILSAERSKEIKSNGNWSSNQWATHYLENINPKDYDWETWRNALFAAHDSGIPEDVVRSWSMQSEKHTDSGFNDVWNYIKGKEGTSITAGTLHYLAKGQGWNVKQAFDAGYEKPKEETDDLLKELEEFNQSILDYIATEDPILKMLKLPKIAAKHKIGQAQILKVVEKKTAELNIGKKTSFSGAELFRHLSDGTQWLVPRFVPNKGLTLLCGFSKEGKSTLMYDLIVSLLKGRKFLDQDPNGSYRVLLIQTEEHEGQARQNIDGAGYWSNLEECNSDSLRVEFNWNIYDTDSLESWIIEHKPDLVCFDSLRKISRLSGLDENKPEFSIPFQNLHSKLRELDVPSLMIHHTNKSKDAKGLERISGSGAIPSVADNIWMFASDPTNPKRKMLSLKGRECSGQFIVDYEQGEGDDFTITCAGETGIDAEDKSVADRALAAIRKNIGLYPEGVPAVTINNALGYSADGKHVYKALNHLIARKMLAKHRFADSRVIYYYIPGEHTPPSIQKRNQEIMDTPNTFPSTNKGGYLDTNNPEPSNTKGSSLVSAQYHSSIPQVSSSNSIQNDTQVGIEDTRGYQGDTKVDTNGNHYIPVVSPSHSVKYPNSPMGGSTSGQDKPVVTDQGGKMTWRKDHQPVTMDRPSLLPNPWLESKKKAQTPTGNVFEAVSTHPEPKLVPPAEIEHAISGNAELFSF